MIKKLEYKVKKYAPIFLGSLLFSVVIYSMLMSESLTNNVDGLWNYSYRIASDWELSIGRWFLIYLDSLHFGISSDPLASLISLSFFTLGMILILDIFEIKKKKSAFLISILFLSNIVVCTTLSYRYESLTFAFSFFLSILAAFVIIKVKKMIIAIPVAAILIGIMMGCYQTGLSCLCIVLLMYYIYSLYEKELFPNLFKDLIKGLLSIVVGGIIYIILLKIHLNIHELTMSTYNNANMYSITNSIKKLPDSIVRCYEIFSNYFKGKMFNINIFPSSQIYPFVLITFGILFFDGLIQIWKKSKIHAFTYLLSILIIPIACNAILLIATDTWISIQMTVPFALCLPLLFCLNEKIKHHSLIGRIFNIVNIVLLITILYGSIYMGQIDQNAMLEGRTATATMASAILYKIDEAGYLDEDTTLCFVGSPSDNPLFKTPIYFKYANEYAKFGRWNKDSACSTQSWTATFSNLLGVKLKTCSVQSHKLVITEKDVMNMPVFPEKGFIAKKDDLVIVKIANTK